MLHLEARPVEIQQLISNLCANASSVDHLSGCGGDPWYDGKYLLAIFSSQEQVHTVTGPMTTNSGHINYKAVMLTNLNYSEFFFPLTFRSLA